MGDIVNLQQYRKKLKRARVERQAAGNRARHGQSRVKRRELDADARRAERELEGKRVERPSDDTDTPPSSR